MTPALEPVLERLAPLNLPAGPVEEFPGEGTREVYLGSPGQAARLLLLQPLSAMGPYARALKRRGPGLHHVALRTEDLEAQLEDMAGWLLHPHSLRSIPACRTAWLARDGIGTLLEVAEGPSPCVFPPLVERLEAPAGDRGALLEALGLSPSDDAEAWLSICGRRWSAGELAS